MSNRGAWVITVILMQMKFIKNQGDHIEFECRIFRWKPQDKQIS